MEKVTDDFEHFFKNKLHVINRTIERCDTGIMVSQVDTQGVDNILGSSVSC